MAFDPSLLLFVPADRPDRFVKALDSGATGAILDLEDAVSLDRKDAARDAVRAFLDAHDDLSRVAVRVNPAGTPDGRADLAMLAGARRAAAVVVPKVGDTHDLGGISDATGDLKSQAQGLVDDANLPLDLDMLNPATWSPMARMVGGNSIV